MVTGEIVTAVTKLPVNKGTKYILVLCSFEILLMGDPKTCEDRRVYMKRSNLNSPQGRRQVAYVFRILSGPFSCSFVLLRPQHIWTRSNVP